MGGYEIEVHPRLEKKYQGTDFIQNHKDLVATVLESLPKQFTDHLTVHLHPLDQHVTGHAGEYATHHPLDEHHSGSVHLWPEMYSTPESVDVDTITHTLLHEVGHHANRFAGFSVSISGLGSIYPTGDRKGMGEAAAENFRNTMHPWVAHFHDAANTQLTDYYGNKAVEGSQPGAGEWDALFSKGFLGERAKMTHSTIQFGEHIIHRTGEGIPQITQGERQVYTPPPRPDPWAELRARAAEGPSGWTVTPPEQITDVTKGRLRRGFSRIFRGR